MWITRPRRALGFSLGKEEPGLLPSSLHAQAGSRHDAGRGRTRPRVRKEERRRGETSGRGRQQAGKDGRVTSQPRHVLSSNSVEAPPTAVRRFFCFSVIYCETKRRLIAKFAVKANSLLASFAEQQFFSLVMFSIFKSFRIDLLSVSSTVQYMLYCYCVRVASMQTCIYVFDSSIFFYRIFLFKKIFKILKFCVQLFWKPVLKI